MEEQYSEEKALLHFMCQAPSGWTLNDIKQAITENSWSFMNWQ
jgi:hypothetical protein